MSLSIRASTWGGRVTSVALRRHKRAVQNKARQLGKPFQDVRKVKAARLAREASEVSEIDCRQTQDGSGVLGEATNAQTA